MKKALYLLLSSVSAAYILSLCLLTVDGIRTLQSGFEFVQSKSLSVFANIVVRSVVGLPEGTVRAMLGAPTFSTSSIDSLNWPTAAKLAHTNLIYRFGSKDPVYVLVCLTEKDFCSSASIVDGIDEAIREERFFDHLTCFLRTCPKEHEVFQKLGIPNCITQIVATQKQSRDFIAEHVGIHRPTKVIPIGSKVATYKFGSEDSLEITLFENKVRDFDIYTRMY